MALYSDLRYAARGLRRAPGFAVAISLTLGLGVGANASMLGAIDRLMFRSFPYLRDPASVHRVYFQTTARGRVSTRSLGPYTAYLDLARDTRSLTGFAAFTEWSLALGPGDAAVEHTVAGVSASFFDFFDARPRLGRFFATTEDSPPRGASVAVLGYDYWQTAFGGRDVVGAHLEIGPLLTTIIGVAPKGFVGVSEGGAPAVFVPITALAFGVNQGDAKSFATKYTWYWVNVMVRRKPGVTAAMATADLTHAFIQSREKQRAQLPGTPPPTVAHPRAIAGSLRTRAGPDVGLESRTLLWVTGVASIVLLIACGNMANLLLARLLGRQRELAVRLALGASRSRLLGQFGAEALVLATLGCLTGSVVAQSVTLWLTRLGIDGNGKSTVIDWRTMLIAAVLALVGCLATYLGPVAVSLRGQWMSSLRSGTRMATRRHNGLQAALLALQATLSVVLLVGAGLFVRSLYEARAVRLGWDPTPILVVTPNYRGVEMDSSARDAFRGRLLETAKGIPGVVAAARVDNLPFRTSTRDLYVDGIDSVARLGRFVSQVVSPDYFTVMSTRITRGRRLDAHDRTGAQRVVVVSESMGRVLWPGADPINRCLRVGAPNAPCTRVVGVAEDAASTSIGDEDRFMYYLSDDQPPLHPANRIFIRVASSDAAASAQRIRRALQRVMPGEAYVAVAPLENLIDLERRSWMLGASMFVAFGGLALVVAAVGLYGVISYQVTQRGHELGVRAALGARAGSVIRLVVGRGITLAAAGAALGLLLAAVAGPSIQPLLFRESATDPLVYALVAATVVVVAFVASLAPTVRALRADPTAALKGAE